MSETDALRDPTDADVDAVLDRLASARESYDAGQDRVDAVGETDLRRLADAHRRATKLMDRYAERATGTGDFQAYVEFQEAFLELVEELPEDLPERDAFERAGERFDKRRLSDRDFRSARAGLQDAEDLTVRLEERDAARERYREARRAALAKRDALDERLADLRATARWEAADLEAPVEDLRAPIRAYNEAIEAAFREFRREASARRVLDVVRAADAYPLVPFRQPPAALAEYVDTRPAGDEPIPTLLAHADRSVPELEHYVEAPRELKRNVATSRTYLRELDAAPLAVDWPPPDRQVLRWRAREMLAVAGRFAPPAPIERLRAVRALTRSPEPYERLRRAARAEARLSANERERLAAGTIEADIERLREQRARLDEALSTAPEAG